MYTLFYRVYRVYSHQMTGQCLRKKIHSTNLLVSLKEKFKQSNLRFKEMILNPMI